jgi:hypothetical protein
MMPDTEIDALRRRVAELEAEKALREQEARDRAFFAVGDEYLFGNRLRWAWRLTKYWWATRIVGVGSDQRHSS